MIKIFLSVIMLSIAVCMQAQTRLYVKPGASGSGSSWGDAGNFQTVISNALAGDSVFVAVGIYQPASGQSFTMKQGVKIYGGFAGTETNLNQRNLAANLLASDSSLLKGNGTRVINNSSNNLTAAAVLDGFTITGGDAGNSFGGGMYNVASSPTLTNCIFSGNVANYTGAGYGGGMYNSASSPILTNCIFLGNTSAYGGGLNNVSSSSPTFINCTFSGNTSGFGGSMLNNNASPSFTNCTFTGNSAINRGGGMYNANASSPSFTNCTFSGNSAGSNGGGMYNISSSPTITNCNFLNNNASGSGGGGIYNENSSSPVITNTVFTANTANSGGGMANISSSSPKLTNCTFSGNSATSGGGMHNSSSASPKLTKCTFSGNSANRGGGMLNGGTSPTLTYCIFSGNNAANYGGGMLNENYSSTILTNCTFSINTSGYDAGGMFNTNYASPTLINCAFSGNTAANDGGGIGNDASSPTITNCTFWGNTAVNNGGGINNQSLFSIASTIITNSIFWGNTGSSGVADMHNNNPGNITINYNFTQADFTSGGTGNITSNKNPFANSGNPAGVDDIWGTTDDGLHLKYTAGYFTTGSSPIDAGYNGAIPLGDTTDITGAVRIQNTTVDMGAYEGAGANIPLPLTLINFTGSLQNGIAKLQWQSGAESNFSHYALEVSTEIYAYAAITTGGFSALSTIAAKGSNGIYKYSIAQEAPAAYYRLKMVDKDGSSKFSSIVHLSQKANNKVLMYPNPAHSYIQIKLHEAGNIKIYDALGRLVKTQALQAGLNQIDVRALRAGAYYGVTNGAKLNFMKD